MYAQIIFLIRIIQTYILCDGEKLIKSKIIFEKSLKSLLEMNNGYIFLVMFNLLKLWIDYLNFARFIFVFVCRPLEKVNYCLLIKIHSLNCVFEIKLNVQIRNSIKQFWSICSICTFTQIIRNKIRILHRVGNPIFSKERTEYF